MKCNKIGDFTVQDMIYGIKDYGAIFVLPEFKKLIHDDYTFYLEKDIEKEANILANVIDSIQPIVASIDWDHKYTTQNRKDIVHRALQVLCNNVLLNVQGFIDGYQDRKYTIVGGSPLIRSWHEYDADTDRDWVFCEINIGIWEI